MDTLAASIFEGANPSLAEFLGHWGAQFPLLHELSDTPQDPEWHAEGDVAEHTSRVLEETYGQLAVIDMSPSRRLTLVLAALFHDVAKPLTTTTRVIDGKERIVAPRHARAGASYLAYKVLTLGLPRDIADRVLELVAYHHVPKHLVMDDAPLHAYRRLARHADIELLFYLEQADMRGRECADRNEQLEMIHLFGMFAREYEVFGPRQSPKELYGDWWEHITDELEDFDERTRSFVFAQGVRDAEAGDIFTPQEAVARSFGYRESFSHLVVLCGPSGSGKTTWARENLEDYGVVSMDELRRELTGDPGDQSRNGEVRQLAKERLKEHLRKNRDVVWDATNLRSDFRRVPLGIGFDYDAFTTLVAFQMQESEFRRRNEQREDPVPQTVLERQLRSLQWPHRHEAHQLIIVDEDGGTR